MSYMASGVTATNSTGDAQFVYAGFGRGVIMQLSGAAP